MSFLSLVEGLPDVGVLGVESKVLAEPLYSICDGVLLVLVRFDEKVGNKLFHLFH